MKIEPILALIVIFVYCGILIFVRKQRARDIKSANYLKEVVQPSGKPIFESGPILVDKSCFIAGVIYAALYILILIFALLLIVFPAFAPQEYISMGGEKQLIHLIMTLLLVSFLWVLKRGVRYMFTWDKILKSCGVGPRLQLFENSFVIPATVINLHCDIFISLNRPVLVIPFSLIESWNKYEDVDENGRTPIVSLILRDGGKINISLPRLQGDSTRFLAALRTLKLNEI